MDAEVDRCFTKPKVVLRECPRKGYWIISVRIIDEARYFAYLEIATDAIDRLGGRLVIRSPEVIVGAGAPKPRLVVVEFLSLADAQEAFNSIEMQAAMQMYDGIADLDLVIVEGYDDFG